MTLPCPPASESSHSYVGVPKFGKTVSGSTRKLRKEEEKENEVGSVTGSSGVVAGHLLLKGPAMKSGILDWWCGPTITLVRFSASRWKSWSGRGKKTLFLQLKKKSKKKIADQFHSPSARISAGFSTSMKIETEKAGVGVCLLRESRHSGELSAPPSRVS